MKEWIRDIVIYMIFASLIYNLAPDKNYRKYIRLMTGIIMIVIVIRPLCFIFSESGGRELITYMDDMERVISYDASESEETMPQGSGTYDGEWDYFSMSVGESVLGTLEAEGFNVSQASAITDSTGEILRIDIYMEDTSAGSKEDGIIKKLISEVYNVNEDSIYIIRQVR